MNHHLGLYLFVFICETVNGEELLVFAFLSLWVEIKLEADDTCVPTQQCCVRSSVLVMLCTPDSPMVTNAKRHHALLLGSLVQSVFLNLLENIGVIAYDHRQCLMATTFTANAIPGFNWSSSWQISNINCAQRLFWIRLRFSASAEAVPWGRKEWKLPGPEKEKEQIITVMRVLLWGESARSLYPDSSQAVNLVLCQIVFQLK